MLSGRPLDNGPFNYLVKNMGIDLIDYKSSASHYLFKYKEKKGKPPEKKFLKVLNCNKVDGFKNVFNPTL